MPASFDPAVHGFLFANTFVTEPVQDVRFGGLCGGMTYAALDCWNQSIIPSRQHDLPAAGSPLYGYIYQRQVASVLENLDRWVELMFNPFGSLTGGYFHRGIDLADDGQLTALRSRLDAGVPVPIGLFKAGDAGVGPHHQVLSIGYDLGGYDPADAASAERIRLYVYDCNHPAEVTQLTPDPGACCYRNQFGESWMTYFVDTKYRAVTPPPVPRPHDPPPAGLVRELTLDIATGADDLRGGKDNCNATVYFADGTHLARPDINRSARWISHCVQTVTLDLERQVAARSVSSVVLQTTFGGGIGGDNWDLAALTVRDATGRRFYAAGAPLWRFTGENRPYVARLV